MLLSGAGVVSLDDAHRHIDFRTLVLLFGMMVLIAPLRMARFFTTTVEWVAARVHEPTLLLVAVVFVSGIRGGLAQRLFDLLTLPGEAARQSFEPGPLPYNERCEQPIGKL